MKSPSPTERVIRLWKGAFSRGNMGNLYMRGIVLSEKLYEIMSDEMVIMTDGICCGLSVV